jgi:DamX protein
VVPAPTAPAPSQSASTAAPAAPAAAARPAPSGAARDANWILAQPSGAFTLQLVSLSSADRARAYIAQQPDPGAFATYRLMRNGQIFHVVVYGTFPSKAEADQAAARLPRSVGNVQPWVRQFGQVQESIRSTPQ